MKTTRPVLRWSRVLAGTVAIGCVAVYGAGAARPASADSAPHTRVHGRLVSVACFKTSGCIGTGATLDPPGTTLVEHFDASGWSVRPSPNPAGSTKAGLGGLACTSAANCIAVGSYRDKARQKTLAEHWNGNRWTIMATVDPAGSSVADLYRVASASLTSCTAVGWQGATPRTLVEHWNGRKWSIMSSPNPRGATFANLFSVSCLPDDTCTAVGMSSKGTLVEHWNGTRWAIQSSPNATGPAPVLFAVKCMGVHDCVAVGTTDVDFSAAGRSLIEHWNGTSWSIMPSPNPTGSSAVGFAGVSCTASTSCTAVGSFDKPNTRTLVAHWNGTYWSVQPSPNPASSTTTWFDGVSCLSSTNCTAVGYADGYTLAEHWNGIKWSIQATP